MTARAWRDGLINWVAFHVGWFACVLGAARGAPWLGAGLGVAIVALEVARSRDPRAAAALVVGCGALGLVCEQALIATGLVTYAAATPLAWAPPVWLVTLWLLFGTLPDIGLSALRGRPLAAAAVGVVAGPLSYYGGQSLGGIVLHPPLSVALIAIALMWAVALPLIMTAAVRLTKHPAV